MTVPLLVLVFVLMVAPKLFIKLGAKPVFSFERERPQIVNNFAQAPRLVTNCRPLVLDFWRAHEVWIIRNESRCEALAPVNNRAVPSHTAFPKTRTIPTNESAGNRRTKD